MKNSWKLILIIFCASIHSVFSQIPYNCYCVTFKENFNSYNSLLLDRKYNDALLQVVKINTKDPECDYNKLNALIQVYVQLADFSSADSIILVAGKKYYNKGFLKYDADFLMGKALSLMKRDEYDSALVLVINAYKIAKQQKDIERQFNALYYQGNIFNTMRQPDKALEFDKQAYELSLKIGPYKSCRILGNIQAHYGVWFDMTDNIKYLDTVELYAVKTLALSKSNNLNIETAQSFNIIAGVHFERGDLQGVLKYTDSALIHLDKRYDFKYLVSNYSKKCDAYIELKQLNSAKQAADSALKYAKLFNESLLIAYAYERLYEVEKLNGNYKASIYFLERFNEIRDSVRTVEKVKAINSLEQKYKKVENERKIAELKHQKEVDLAEQKIRTRTFIFIIALILLLLLLILFFFRQSVIRGKIKIIESEHRLNRARMNPHFFFNVLSSIQSLILQRFNADKLALMTSKFSTIMRQSLESTYAEMVYVEKEIEFIRDYLDIQLMRFENKFAYNINISDDIEEETIKMPSMLIQPFVENSIEHGFKGLDYAGVIEIDLEIENNRLKITCSDNGKGFKMEGQRKEYPSRATQIIKERLGLLNKQLKSNAEYFIDSNLQTGTKVTIYLPIIN